MKKNIALSIICFLVVLSGTLYSQQGTDKFRIGTFDSRCVALAYGRSTEFMQLRDSIETLYSKAKADSNKEKIDEIEQYKPTMQVLLHQQVFSNGSIVNIVEKITGKISSIAKENKLNMILSKWEITFTDGSIELIDITDQLTALFNPDEATNKIIKDIKAMEPIPIEKISINPMD